jgi:hypothetical protein
MGFVAVLFGILTAVAFCITGGTLMEYGPKHENTKYSALLMVFATVVLIGTASAV